MTLRDVLDAWFALTKPKDVIERFGFLDWSEKHIQLKDGSVFAFAGLWLLGKRGGLPTAAIVTTRPNALMATIHNRMPVILRRGDERAWLDASATDVERCLEPIEAEQIQAYPVSLLVNSWENEGSELIAPSRSPTEVQMALPLD